LYQKRYESQAQKAYFSIFLAARVYPVRLLFLFLAKQKDQPKLTRLSFRSWRCG